MTLYFIADVMFGRGGECTYHPGNIAFRQLVEDHKVQYYTTPRSSKSQVVVEVVRKWRTQNNPPGRFLTRSTPSNTGSGIPSLWHDVGDHRAQKKASHSLRDSVRCLSMEQKQREEEEKQDQSGDTSEKSTKSGGASCPLHPIGSASNIGQVSDSDVPASSTRVTTDLVSNRRRGRGANTAVTITRNSSCATSLQAGGAFQEVTSALLYGDKTMRGTQKKKEATVPSPPKRQRAVSDEREDAQEFSRKRQCVVSDEREDAQEYSRLRHQISGKVGKDVLSSDMLGDGRDEGILQETCSLEGIPFTISWGRIVLPSSLDRTSNVERAREESNASPCESADWFSSLSMGAEMPVQYPHQQALPLASALIGEVSNVHAGNSSLPTDDEDDSLGWLDDHGAGDIMERA